MKYRYERLVIGLIVIIYLYYSVEAVILLDFNRLYLVVVPALFCSLLPFLFEYAAKARFPAGVKELVALALLLHVAGGISRFYWKFAPFYDKFAHMVSALALVLLVFCFFAVLDLWGKHVPEIVVFGGAALITTFFMIGWEVAEMYIDVMMTSSYSNGYDDAIGDLVADWIGLVLGLVLIRYYTMRIPAGKTIGWLMARAKA